MEKKKNVSITLRLTREDAEKFKLNAIKNKVSQSEYLVQLMSSVGNSQKNMGEQSGGDIHIILYKKNVFSPDNEKQNLLTKKIIVKGKGLVFPRNLIIRPLELYGEELKKEFDINQPLDDFVFSHVLNLIQLEEEEKFLVNEIINITNKETKQIYLNVSRCLYVKGYNEVLDKFGKYADEGNLYQIEYAMAKKIEGSTEELEEYF